MKELFDFILGIILWAILIWFIIRMQRKTNFWWKFIGKIKWRIVQQEIIVLENTHKTATGDFSFAAKVWDKVSDHYTDKVKKATLKYYDYLDFCRAKNIEMPENKDEIDELIEKTEESLMFDNELLSKKLEQAYHEYDDTFKLVDESGQKLFAKRQESVELIESISELINSIASHPKEYQTSLKEIHLQKEEFKQTIQFAEEQYSSLKKSLVGTGAGAAAGVAVATLGPSAAMWVATTFGTASTGTAISALSGAAASNAALAWLGGGAAAAGGGGVASGQALLALAGPIGVGIATASLLISVLVGWRKYKKIKEEKRDEIDRMKRCIGALKDVKVKIDDFYLKVDAMYNGLKEVLISCNGLMNADYLQLSNDNKMKLGMLLDNTINLANMLNKVIIEEDNE